MKIVLTKKYISGVMVLPVLFSCSTIDHEVHTNHNEHSKKIVAAPIPAGTNYGKLIKISSPADALFGFDSAALKPSSVQILENLARELQDDKNDFIVVGYTDRIGVEGYNKELSLRRAETVKIHLISKGIDPNRIFTHGKGEANPVTGSTCDENMKRETLIDCLSPDRRVEVNVRYNQ